MTIAPTKQAFFDFFSEVQNVFEKELVNVDKLKEKKLQEYKEETHLTTDDFFQKRKELIENYSNKIFEIEEFKKMIPSLEIQKKNEINEFKLAHVGKANTLLIEEDDDVELEILKTEINKKKFEIHNNNIKNFKSVDCIYFLI